MRRPRVGVIVADHAHADLRTLEDGVIDRDGEVRRRRALRTGHEGHAGGGDGQRPREFTPCGMHACSVRVRQKVNAVPKYYTRCRSAFAPAPGALLHLPTAIGVALRLLTTRTRAACRPRC